MIPLVCPSANLQGLAEELASNLRINAIISNQPTDQPYLYLSEAGLSFFHPEARSKNKFQIDFNSGSTGWRVKISYHEKLLKKALGHKVIALEQSKILFYLLQDALRRSDDQSIFEKLDLIHTNACSYAAQAKNFDVVYFDPMYPLTKKNALTSGKLDYISKILEIESINNDSLEDFEQLQLIPAKKMVVKRSIKAEPFSTQINYQVAGKTTRFDVYI